MKQKTLLFAAILFACTFSFSSLNAQTLLVDEEFSSSEWEAELLRLNPGTSINPNATNPVSYTTPTTLGGAGAYNNLNATDLYFDKYKLAGAIEVIETGLCSAGLTHANPTLGTAVAFRFANGTGIFELPELPTAGTITIHVKNGNNTNDCNLGLEKYNSGTDTWELINLFLLRKRNDLKNENGDALLDEALSYEINSNAPIKLRLNNFKFGDLSTRFLNMYHISVTEYIESAVVNPHADIFKQVGRKLLVDQPVRLTLYNVVGSKVFEQQVENEIEIPASVGSGVFFVKSNSGCQKIFLN